MILWLLGAAKWAREAAGALFSLIGPFRGRASMFSCSQLG